MPAIRRLPSLALLAPLIASCVLGGSERLEDRTAAPRFPGTVLERVADLDYPPGNIAVSQSGRVFFTFHPDGSPPVKVVELVDGKPVPYPSADFQQPRAGAPHFDTVLSVRIDGLNRLWTLDHARYARGQARLVGFDLANNQVVHEYQFPSAVAPFLSMLNDFQISPDGSMIYIADASPIRHNPAIVVYDVTRRTSRRLLEDHPSVQAGRYVTQAPGRDMIIFGFYNLRIGIDSIALDRRGEWLYYGPFTGDRLYRVRTTDLRDESLAADALAARVENFGPKTISDGLTSDDTDHIYISDPEHSAILTIGPERRLETLVKDPLLRWPDGFSFGPEGWLYVTCSALHHVLFVSNAHMREHAPYQILRFKPAATAAAGQ